MGIEVNVSAEARRANEQARDNATRTTTTRVYGVSEKRSIIQHYLRSIFSSDYYTKLDAGMKKNIELFLRGFKHTVKEDLSAKAPVLPATVYAVDRNKLPMSADLQDIVASWNLKPEPGNNAPEANRLMLHKELVQKDYGHVWN